LALLESTFSLGALDLFLLEALLVSAVTTVAAAAVEAGTNEQTTQKYEDSTRHAGGEYTVGPGGNGVFTGIALRSNRSGDSGVNDRLTRRRRLRR
jgi:hypothetical protein